MQNKYVAGFLEKQGVCDGLICLGRPTWLHSSLSMNQEAGPWKSSETSLSTKAQLPDDRVPHCHSLRLSVLVMSSRFKFVYKNLLFPLVDKFSFILNKKTLFHKGHSSGHTYQLPFETDGKSIFAGYYLILLEVCQTAWWWWFFFL